MPGHATPRSYLYVLNYLAGPQLYVVYVEYVQLATMIMIMIMITENTVIAIQTDMFKNEKKNYKSYRKVNYNLSKNNNFPTITDRFGLNL